LYCRIKNSNQFFLIAKKKKKKKTTSSELSAITDSLSKTQLNWPGKEAGSSKKPEADAATDPAKKLKNMKKRLREIEILEQKIESGEVKPDKDQLEKLKRREPLMEQIADLEAEMGT